jgi:hypothetical protein
MRHGSGRPGNQTIHVVGFTLQSPAIQHVCAVNSAHMYCGVSGMAGDAESGSQCCLTPAHMF